MSKDKLKVRFVKPNKDYMNINVPLSDIGYPENEDEWKGYAKRYDDDYGTTPEDHTCNDFESWKRAMDEEEILAENHRSIYEDEDDVDEEDIIHPDDIVGVYDHDKQEFIWIPYKDAKRY